MEIKKPNRRVKKTKSVLRKSLLELMKTESLNKITVKSICKNAGINRGTFYSHYKSPSELLKSIENDFFTDLVALMRSRSKEEKSRGEDTKKFVSDIVNCVYENADICKHLLSGKNENIFVKQAVNSAFPVFTDDISVDNTTALRARYEYEYVANGCIAIIQKWICDGMKEDRHFITDLICDMATKSPYSFA